MPLRRCLDCGTPTDQTRCPTHRKDKRPSAWARGYNRAHQDARAQLKLTLPAPCARGCGTWLTPDGKWFAAHIEDHNPHAGWIATCQPCNEAMKH